MGPMYIIKKISQTDGQQYVNSSNLWHDFFSKFKVENQITMHDMSFTEKENIILY